MSERFFSPHPITAGGMMLVVLTLVAVANRLQDELPQGSTAAIAAGKLN